MEDLAAYILWEITAFILQMISSEHYTWYIKNNPGMNGRLFL